MYQAIQWEVKEHIGILRLNRPERLNAIDNVMRNEMEQVLRAAEADPDVWTIIATGNGRGFCSGADLKARAEAEKAGAGGTSPQPLFDMKYYYAIGFSQITKPVIAAVEGYAVGAGMALPSACDYVVASSAAKFSAGFMKIGFVPDLGMMWTLPRRVGLGRAKKLMALSNEISAAEAERIGLVEEIAEPGKALEAALKVAEKYAHIAPLAFELLKDTLAEGLDEVLKAEIDMQPILMLSEDHEEGKRAFFEKRRPKFTGR